MADVDIEIRVNGVLRRASVPPRLTLADYLREHCQLTGTHLGCEHGVCADGTEVTTIEAIASPDGELSPVQAAFRDHHGLQCGFCTPGFIISATAFLRDHPDPTDEQIRDALSGNLCRCTGYQGILKAVRAAAKSASKVAADAGSTHQEMR
jgi:carbon-monoxide dehydrogenase small subunit